MMTIEETIRDEKLDFSGISLNYYLLGLLSAFENRFQTAADNAMGEISWKQFFAIICINLFKEPPTLRELSEILGSSHQNVKQILLKLEKKKFIELQPDITDKRKQRIFLTDHCKEFCEKNNKMSEAIMDKMFRGISQNDLATTIRTITIMEKNLQGDEKGRESFFILQNMEQQNGMLTGWLQNPVLTAWKRKAQKSKM